MKKNVDLGDDDFTSTVILTKLIQLQKSCQNIINTSQVKEDLLGLTK